MPVRVPTVQTGLEASIEAAAKKAGRNLKINLGTSAKSIEGLSQPLGRITGKADQFTKSMEAANARVLAFGASVGVLSAVTKGFKDLVTTTIEVEKALTSINSILNTNAGALDQFKKTVFDVARNTEQSFDTVAQAALELSRQGLTAEEVIKRLNDSMVLARLSGLGASEAVAGMTAAINSFSKAGVTSEQVLNKLSAASVKAAVSERDLIEGLKRSASVANQAGVSLDELIGVITAVQQKTARGGSVIGNSFKTIFTRIQSLDKLQTMQNLGVQITDVSGEILSGTKLIENLAKTLEALPEARKLQIAENLVGKFQIAPFLAILDDYSSKTSIALKITEEAKNATSEAYNRNVALNKTLAAAINEATLNLKELANTLGEIGVTDSLKNILGFFNNLIGSVKGILEGEGLGSDFARGIVKGIGNVLSGPGLAIFGAIIAKLTIDLVKFGTISLQTFFGLNKTAKDQAAIQGQIASTLLGNKSIQDQILKIENSTLSIEQKRAAQTKFFTTALNEQLAVMTRMQAIAGRVAPGVLAGTRVGGRRAAEGYIPNFNAVRGYGQEKMDIAKGVGGAPPSARPVAIPNFNFGGGQKGTMIANTSEVLVPNYKGGGSAVFNQEMLGSMGMPSGGRAIRGAQGYIPNFSLNQMIRNMQASGTLQGARVGNTDSYRIGDKVVYGSQVKKALASGGGNPQKRGELVVDATKYGVAAMFASKKTDTSFANIDTLTAPLAKVLKKRGVTGIRFQGIQVRDLENDFTTGLRKKSPHSPRKNRNLIAQLFANPLAQYGHKLIGSTFSNDEATKLSNEVNKVSKSGGGVNLFPSAVEGGIFEAAIRVVTKGAKAIDEFKNHTSEQTPFDFEETGPASKQFMDTWQFRGSKGRMFRADAKRTATNEAVQTIISKALRGDKQYVSTQATKAGFPTLSQLRKQRRGKTAASGYIPNFAVSPLDMAIERERGAGVPINQIRINQDAGLRNARNPMGLAVTNTRDEPTGAVPNFAKTPTGEGGGMGMGDAVGKLLIFSTAIQMASGLMGGLTEDSKILQGTFKLLNTAVVIASVAMMTGFGNMKSLLMGIPAFFMGKGKIGAMGAGMMASGTQRMTAGRNMARGVGGAAWATKTPKPVLGGLKMLGGALTKVGGTLLRFAGPVGAAIGAVMLLKGAFELIGGSGKRLKESQESLTKANEQADKELSEMDLGEAFENMMKGESQRQGTTMAKDFMTGGPRLMQVERNITWTTKEDDFEEQLAGAISSASKAGLSQAAQGILNKFESRFPLITIEGDELSPDITRFEDMTQDAFMDMLGEIKKLPSRDVSGALKGALMGIDLDTRSKLVEGQRMRDSVPEGQTARGFLGRDLIGEIGGFEKSVAVALSKKTGIDETFTRKALQNATKGVFMKQVDTKDERMAQIQANLSKIELKNQFKILEVRSKRLGMDEKALEMMKTSGKFLDEELIAKKAFIDIRKNEEQVSLNIANIIKKEIDGIEKLSLKDEEHLALKRELENLSIEQLQDEDKRADLVNRINKLGGKATEEGKKLLELVEARVKGEQDVGDEIQQNITTSARFEASQARIKRQLEERITLRRQNRESSFFDDDLEIRKEESRIGREIGAVNRDTSLGPISQAQQVAQLNFELRGEGIKRDELNAVNDFRGELETMSEEFSFLEGDLKEIDKILQKDGFAALEQSLKDLDKLLSKDRFSIKLPFGLGTLGGGKVSQGKTGEGIRDLLERGRQALSNINFGKKESKDDLKDDKEDALRADGFKTLTQILLEFGRSLKQVTEQLKFDFAFTRSGGDMISTMRSQLDTAKRDRLGKNDLAGQARITRDSVFDERSDQIFLARTSAERRNLQRENPILEKQFAIQEEIAALSKDMVLNEDLLIQKKKELLDLEKKRLEVNDSLKAKLENAFVFTQQEIDNKLTTDLVSAARQFTDRISDGLVDAIAKGKSLGETLRTAAADFFLDMARANMRAAMSNITSGIGGFLGANSGGMITGGSGVRDDIPTMLTGGEYVMRKGAVSRYGVDFMEALNKGSIQTMQRGGLFTPGSYGQEAITGKRDLLDFATQSHTMGQFDRIGSGSNYASVALEPQSGALTMFGRRNSPMFAREQRSKEQAFGLYTRQYEYEEELKERERQQKKALRGAILGAVISAGLNFATGGFGKKPTPNPNQTSIPRAIPVDPSEVSGGGLNNIFSRNYNRGRDWAQNLPGFLGRQMDRKATGGAVPYAAGVDTVPTMLSGGEFVMNAAATDRVGRGNLASLNSGGGDNGDVVGRLDELIDVSENRGESTINITVNSDGSSDQDGGGDQDQQALAVRIRDVVKQVIEDEKRLGGSLRQVRA